MGDDELLAENADLHDAVEEMERELRRLRAEAQSRAQDTTRLVAENDALSAENEALIEDLLRHRSSAAEVHARESRLQAALETQAATAAELQTELHKANAKAAGMRESSSAAEVHARESRLQAALETQAATAAELQTELHKANAKAADMRESICKLERENFEFRRMVDACQEIAADAEAARASLEDRAAELQQELRTHASVRILPICPCRWPMIPLCLHRPRHVWIYGRMTAGGGGGERGAGTT